MCRLPGPGLRFSGRTSVPEELGRSEDPAGAVAVHSFFTIEEPSTGRASSALGELGHMLNLSLSNCELLGDPRDRQSAIKLLFWHQQTPCYFRVTGRGWGLGVHAPFEPLSILLGSQMLLSPSM